MPQPRVQVEGGAGSNLRRDTTLLLQFPNRKPNLILVNARELKRWLKQRGCTFETHRGGSGHLTVRRGARKSQLPMHGSRKELGSGLVRKIKKDLGLE